MVVAVKSTENHYASTAVLAYWFSMLLTKVRNTDDTGLIPVQHVKNAC